MKIKILCSLVLTILIPVSFVFAQNSIFDLPTAEETFLNPNSGLPIGIEEQISIDVFPEIPKPGEQVNISVESYSTDLNKANFTWKANGENVQQGTGLKNLTFFAPESGKTLVINLTIQKNGGGIIERSFSFSPADVDIIYEAETYTHPFYKGKALFTSESEVRFIAMPIFLQNGTILNPNNLVYTWSVNGNVDQANSGYGKRTYRAKSGLINRSFSVEVEVSALNSGLKASSLINLKNSEPEIVIYENNPLLGIVFEKAIFGNFLLERPEIEFQAVPFYFSTIQKDNSFVDYIWKMNGSNIQAGARMSAIIFRNESGKEGRSVISVDIKHVKNILQSAAASINLTFKENANAQKNNVEF